MPNVKPAEEAGVPKENPVEADVAAGVPKLSPVEAGVPKFKPVAGALVAGEPKPKFGAAVDAGVPNERGFVVGVPNNGAVEVAGVPALFSYCLNLIKFCYGKLPNKFDCVVGVPPNWKPVEGVLVCPKVEPLRPKRGAVCATGVPKVILPAGWEPNVGA